MMPEKIGRYTVSSLLGRGGFAVVYLASDPFVKRQVAIKVLPAQFADTEAMRARFQQEAEIIAALEHSAIVPIYDYGNHGGQPFIVMRYMAGGSLAERLGKGPIGIEDTAKILRRLGSALDRAHDQGIIHRDLKPGNILFDQYGDAYLSDFGIARLTEASLKLTGGGAIGTPAYMSPEQVYGDRTVDGRSDIYALGVILFEMLTGTIPYEADTPAKLMMKHVLEPVPRILAVKPDLPSAYEDIMGRALAKEPENRFAKASEFTSAVTLLSPTRPAQEPPIAEPTQVSPPKSSQPVVEETMLETPTPPKVRQMTKPTQVEVDTNAARSEKKTVATSFQPLEKATTPASNRPSWFRPGLIAVGALAIIVFLVAVVLIGSNLFGGDETAESPNESTTGQTDNNGSNTEPIPFATTGSSENLPEAEGVLALDDLRDFQELGRLGRGFLTGMAVNPDGNILAAGSSIGVWLYDVDTLEPITLLEGHTAPVMDVDWSPDGRFLATAGQDNQIRIWDIEGRQERFLLEGHQDMVTSVDWSHDGQFLASGGYDHIVRIWNMENGRLVQSIEAHNEAIRMVSWHPNDSSVLVTASEDGTAKTWFYPNARLDIELVHSEIVETAFWSLDGSRLFTGGHDGLIKIWDIANGDLINEIAAHEFGLITMALSVDGQLLATTGGDGFIRVWDTVTEQEVASWGGETSGPVAPAWLPGNERLALSFEDNLLGVFQIDNPSATNVIRAHTGQIGSIAWTPEGRGLVSGHNGDDMTYLWNLETQERAGALPGFTSGDGKSISISANGDLFVRPKVGIEAFNLTNGLRPNMEPFFIGPDDSYVNVAELSPDAEQLAAVNYDGTIRVWNLSDQALIFETGGAGAGAMAWSPDGRFIATPGDNETIIIVWDSQSGERIHSFEFGSSANITGLDWSPEGRFLAAVDTEGILRIWDSDGWGLSLSFQSLGTSLNSLDWSPDGRWLAAGSWSGSIYVWDATGAGGEDPVLYIDLAHRGPVVAIAWSSDNTKLASGSHDGTVKIWGGG